MQSSFDPVPYLTDPVVRKAYLDPNTLRKPIADWPKCRPAHVNCSRQQLLKLAAKWDDVGALRIVPAEQVNESELVGLFAIPKDREFDRLIIDPTTINSRCQGYSNFTRLLAPGALLTQLHLDDGEVARFSADDLTEIYYTYVVSDERSKRNALRMKFDASEVRHFKAFQPGLHVGSVFLCLATLGMGDQLSVEVAQQSHWNVLAFRAGAMLPGELLAYRRPFPRTATVEMLAIDDHVVCQKLSASEAASEQPKRDTLIFERSGQAYRDVGLVQHPKKRKRNLQRGTLLGAEVDGEAGWVAAPRHRVGALMMATAVVARKGVCTPALLSSLLGLWVHVLMYRRPALSILGAAFSDAQKEPRNRVIALQRATLNELLALVMLGPVPQTDIRVGYVPRLYSMDASPAGAGIAYAPVPEEVIKELWRHGEHRGYYTKLEGGATALLREQGFDTEPWFGAPENFLPGPKVVVPTPLREGVLYDVAELFGSEKNWTVAHAKLGLRCCPDLLCQGQPASLLRLLQQPFWREVVGLVLRGVVREWHFGPASLSFSLLQTPRRRSKLQPLGFDLRDPTTKDHNSAAQRLAFLLSLIVTDGKLFSVAEPKGSVMFRLHCFRVLVLQGAVYSRVQHQHFGSPFANCTIWLHNKPWVHEATKSSTVRRTEDCLPVVGRCTSRVVQRLQELCRPSVSGILGDIDPGGYTMSKLASLLPCPLCERLAAGSLAETAGQAPLMPLSAKARALKEAWDFVDLHAPGRVCP